MTTPSVRYCRYVLAVLFIVNVFNVTDRMVLSILLQPIKIDLGLSDTQLGLLSGIAFAVFYSLAGFPIAWWADHGNRSRILALCLTIWSAMTALCSAATSFSRLFLIRVGVGIGEAGGTPCSQSLLVEYFPPRERALAFSILSLGIPVGVLLGIGAGGWIGQLYGWRSAFMAVGVPGILPALMLYFTVRDPRQQASRLKSLPTPANSFVEGARTLLKSSAFRHLAFATSLIAFTAYGSAAWLPAFFIRTHGLNIARVGISLALLSSASGIIGILAGGLIARRLTRNDARWLAWLPAVALLVAWPMNLLALIWPTPYAAMIMSSVPGVLSYMYFGPSAALNQELAPPAARATAVAIVGFGTQLLGLGLGPLLIGVLSDWLAPKFGANALRTALIAGSFVTVWGAAHFYMAGLRTARNPIGFEQTASLPR